MTQENPTQVAKSMAAVKNGITLLKDGIGAIKDLIIMIVILVLFFNPELIGNVVDGAHMESIKYADLEMKFNKTTNELKDINLTVGTLEEQNNSLQGVLDKAAVKVTDPQLKTQIATVTKDNAALLKSVDQAKKGVARVLDVGDAKVGKIMEANVKGKGWGVVYAGEPTLKGAQYEVNEVAKMPQYNIPNAKVYKRRGSFRSVSVVQDKDEAEAILKRVKARRKDAYIVTMSSWCPDAVVLDEYCECKN